MGEIYSGRCGEVNNLQEHFTESEITEYKASNITVHWNDEELAKITRLRLLTDHTRSFWDMSYCWGLLKSGEKCRVTLPFTQLVKGRLWTHLREEARRDKVDLHALGMWDAISKLWG